MSERFFVEVSIAGDRALLVGTEAHHLAHVMRAREGELVTLFDGSGDEFAARVTNVGRAEIELSVLGRQTQNRESPVRLTLAVALPKGDRQRWLVEKGVELGVAKIVPLTTERGVAQAVDGAAGKLRRAVIEASKQCGRNTLLVISEPQSVKDLFEASHDGALRILAHPGGVALAGVDRVVCADSASKAIVAAIGPEGGFAEDEVALAATNGWTVVDLGPRILRVETAALAVAAWAALG